MPFPVLAGVFFFSSWLAMVFWGMISPDIGVPTIGYPKAMLVTIGLWLVVFPLVSRSGGGSGGAKFGMKRSSGEPRKQAWGAAGEDAIDISSSFTSTARRITSQSFEGGNVSASFAGVQLDLRKATLSDKGAVLNVKTFLGGVDLTVPDGWDVEFDVSAFMGAVSDERSTPEARRAGAQRLKLTGSVFLGGIVVKSG